jgi:2-polyprenyl-3-methyl-5-hydroxy-6-metoxy-1,4-benzoquinol methylase
MKRHKYKTSQTRSTSQWDVDRYQNQQSFVWQYGFSLIDLLDPQPGERILDVGCGSGELTNSIAERGDTGIGFDFDRSVVKRADKNNFRK